MATKSVDCRFFLLGSCRNGDACPFRHSGEARDMQETCTEFAQTGQCSTSGCSKRHGEAPRRATKPPSEVPCRNEENGGECARPGCIFKHARASATGPTAGLNAGAKVFVPKARQAANMEWTAESTAAPATQPARPQPFGNMEWTPKVPSTPATVATAKPPGQVTFGNREWTPKGPVNPGMAPTTQPARPPTFGNMEWTPKGVDAQSAVNARHSGCGATAAASHELAVSTRLAKQPQRASKPSTVGSVQTIFDILGIAEEKPEEAVERHSRQGHQSRVRAHQGSSAGSSAGANSPASGVCYAPEFSAYVLGDTASTPAADPVVETKAASPPMPTIVPPAPSLAAQPARGADKPPSTTTTAPPSSSDSGLPKVLSFQEIMDRKRRKQAAAAAAEAKAATASTPIEDEPRTPAKRPIEAQAPSGKRARPAATKNYIALFERELDDLSAGLSGPLENSPSSDRISRATLGDTYVDADLWHLLDS
ncbi:hypothetical protein H4R19_003461 [Coemansia spiralis]|nr:hypothetical protein H4R19_003461 [Coemansia spiralis]